MADRENELKENISQNNTERLNGEAVYLLASVMLSLASGMNEETIYHDMGPVMKNIRDAEGNSVVPESFVELARKGIENLREDGLEEREMTEDSNRILQEALETWRSFHEDAFLRPDADLEDVMKDMAATISNSLDAEDITGYFITDADILEITEGREVTSANIFREDGSPDPEGIFSEKIFGPVHGVSCECGKTGSCSENGTVIVGEICPECETPVRSCSERKTSWAYALSPIPLLYGRQEMIGAMMYGLMSSTVKGFINSDKLPITAGEIIERMAQGDLGYTFVGRINSDASVKQPDGRKKTYVPGTMVLCTAAEARPFRNNPEYRVKGGIRGIEMALEYFDENGNGAYEKEKNFSALWNAYSYYDNMIKQCEGVMRSGKDSTRRRVSLRLEGAKAAYSAVYSFINGRKSRPSEILLHAIPVPPPGMRPLNDRNGVTDLGDINETLQKFLQASFSFSRIINGHGFAWIDPGIWTDNCERLYSAQKSYLEAVQMKLAGKTGAVRGRQKSDRTKNMAMAVIVPDGMERGYNALKNAGLRDIVPQMIVEIPASGLRNMYEKEIRSVLKESGMTGAEIREALRVPPGTMTDNGKGGKVRCAADLATEAVICGYGDGRNRKSGNPEFGRLFVSEGNPYGMSRSQAREKHDGEIRSVLRDSGYSPDEIRTEMAKTPGTKEEGIPCLADRVLEEICHTGQGGLIAGLSRDPVIKATGLQFAYISPNYNGDVIKVHPLLMKGFDGDFDGDRIAAIRLVQRTAHAKVKKLVVNAFREDGTGDINQLPTLESLIGLHRMTKSYGDRPDYSLKYNAVITNTDDLVKSGDVRNGIAVRATDLIAHRIIREFGPGDGNITVTAEKNVRLAPGEPYGRDAEGRPVYSDKACFVTEAEGKLLLVDSFSDTVRIPKGAVLKAEGNRIMPKETALAEARMFRGTLSELKTWMEKGYITPMSRVMLEEEEGTAGRMTTAGRSLTERHLPPEVHITGENGISKKWISAILDEYAEKKASELTEHMPKKDAYVFATRETMEYAADLAAFGFNDCSHYFSEGATYQDFNKFLPIDTSVIGSNGRIPDTPEGQAEYRRMAKEKGNEYHAWIRDFNTSYLADIVGSGEKGVGLIEAVANRNVTNMYDGGALETAGGNVVAGLYGYRDEIAVAESQRTNNKTFGVDVAGSYRNRTDAIADGMLLEESDCGSKMFLNGPLNEKNLSDYEGRTLAEDVYYKSPSGKTEKIGEGMTLTSEILKTLYVSGQRTIPYRSAITCRCEGVCETCAGTHKHVQAEVGADVGHAATSVLFQPISQNIMDVAKKAMASGGKKDTGISTVQSFFDGGLLAERVKQAESGYDIAPVKNHVFSESERDSFINGEEGSSGYVDSLSRLLLYEENHYLPGSGEREGEPKKKTEHLDAIRLAQLFSDVIMDLADRKIPPVYAEVLAKRFIMARPETMDDTKAPESVLMSVTELVNRGLRGKDAFQVLNPGVFLSKGGKDAAVDAVSKGGMNMAQTVATAMANVTKGTSAQTVPPQKEEYRNILKQKSKNMENLKQRGQAV